MMGIMNAIRKTLGIIIDILMILILIFASSEWTMPGFWGTANILGHNLYLLDWEQGKQIIVWCPSDAIKGRVCYGGNFLIPRYEESYMTFDKTSKRKRQYVEDIRYDKRHIIVKTRDMGSDEKTFFIVYKSFDIQEAISEEEIRDRYMYETTDSMLFVRECETTGVNLHF